MLVRTPTLKIRFSLSEELVFQTITARVSTAEMNTVKFTLILNTREHMNLRNGTLLMGKETKRRTSTQLLEAFN